ncbi:beta-N-acetylhexosaminidase [Dyella sedimenti]|uniref:beta-N-acetylhexosaminidase n=1 Tax=Dyella sedimenti TaxID=2919947 RepID=UPI001FA9E99D|nr:family 20 glycosylhydrolase [Dyella sedimenti]
MSIARFLAFLSFCGLATVALAQSPSVPPLIPLPAQIEYADGGFEVDAGTLIAVGDHDASTRQTADYLAGLLSRTRGLSLRVAPAAGAAHAIVLQRDPQAPVAEPEGYALDVTPQGIRVVARDDAGLFYGAITLWQWLTPDAQRGAVRVPALRIRDWPRFRWRGLMLDSARHFQSVDEVEGLLDQMAQHKLNIFHWHLTDDQGWRIEIKRYPELTRIGAWRTPPDAGHDGEPLRYGGFYTQAQIRQVVAFAAARHITIVPEIDMPGHAMAAIAAYPQVGVTGQRPSVSVDWGVHPWLYNVDDATFQFIDNVLDEVMALFPSTYIHVGGDEAAKAQWKNSPAVQARMRALGIKDEDALQGWFIGRIGSYLAVHGRRLVGWDEILEGDNVPTDATVMSWRGIDGAVAAARAGHDTVLSPSQRLYFDYVQSEHDDTYAGRLPATSLKSVYDYEPVPKALDAAQARHVLGAQANVWTEIVNSMAHVEHAAFPRLAAFSEVVWSPAASRRWPGFLDRLMAQLARYRTQGIGYADSAFVADIDIDRNQALASGSAQVSLSDQAGYGAIHYTLDGSAPDLRAPLYRAPFVVKLPTTVRAATFAADGSALAAPSRRVLDRASLLSFSGDELVNCPGSDFRQREQPMPDAVSTQPVYVVNLYDHCQQLPATRMDGVAAIHVRAVRLENNFLLTYETRHAVPHPNSTPFGELVVHGNGCDGPVLAMLPLPDPTRSARQFSLQAALPKPQHGEHALCLIYATPTDGPLYVLDRVSLVAAAVPATH